MKRLLLMTGLLLMGLNTRAQDIATSLNLPEWTRDLSVNAAFVNDVMDFEGSNLQDINAQGVVIELANQYDLGEGFWTQSALRGKVTNSEDEFTDVDNKSIGLTQRFMKRFLIEDMALIPSIGTGISYGGVETGFTGDPEDINYISYNGEISIKLDTMKGFAPYLTYNYEVADLENTTNELEIQSFSAGLSVVF